jgi:hypothetical protein
MIRRATYVWAVLILVLIVVLIYRQKTILNLKKQTKEIYMTDEYRRCASLANMGMLAAGIRVYYEFNGRFPAVSANLRDSLERGGVYYSEKKCFPFSPIDNWGVEIRYYADGSTARLQSAGSDMVFGTVDDLMSQVTVCCGTNTVWGFVEKSIWKCSNKYRALGTDDKRKKAF